MRSVFKPLYMHSKKIILTLAILSLINCKKEVSDQPINASVNNQNLDCATCPSLFHPFNDLSDEFIETCDDFTDVDTYPSDFILEEGIIGYTQESAYSITLQEGGFVQINEGETEPGFYGANSLIFDFDGSDQTATFIVYGFEGSFDEMGFGVNGSPIVYYSETFPLTVDGVTVDIDLSIPNIADWEAFEVSFSGEIDYITQLQFESGITELCVSKVTPPEPPVINKDTYVYFDTFYNYDGTELGSYPNYKTPLGYYGLQATNMVIKFDEFLGYEPTRIGFVHAYSEGQSKLVNVQLPNTPLITTIPDSLNYYLEPYGYGIEHYFKTGDNLWVDQSSPPLTGKVLDSIIITGNNINEVILGANLNESELRSICTYYEQ